MIMMLMMLGWMGLGIALFAVYLWIAHEKPTAGGRGQGTGVRRDANRDILAAFAARHDFLRRSYYMED